MSPVEPERQQRVTDAILRNPQPGPKPADMTTLEAWLDPLMTGMDRLYEAVLTDRTVAEFRELLDSIAFFKADIAYLERQLQRCEEGPYG
jgi:hypothetical protein